MVGVVGLVDGVGGWGRCSVGGRGLWAWLVRACLAWQG